ncbi:MAG TPA: ABC transporter permease subunit [Variovorax sp.]|nr:ABC transporter permease subunit [Variovorax sp.]
MKASPFARDGLAAQRQRRRRVGTRALVEQACVALGCLLLWQLLVSFKLVPPAGVAPPGPSLLRWFELLWTQPYWQAVGSTLLGWFLGMSVAVLVAIPLGIVIGLNRFLANSTRFTIDFMRTVPPVALMPVILLLLGPTLAMKLTLILVGTVWPLLIQAIYAAGQVDAMQRDASRTFRLTRWGRIRFLLLPSVTPFVTTGLRIAATVSLLLSVTAEYIGGAPGLGTALAQAEIAGNLPEMYAYILTSATLGVLINIGFIHLQRRLLWWHPSVRTVAR